MKQFPKISHIVVREVLHWMSHPGVTLVRTNEHARCLAILAMVEDYPTGRLNGRHVPDNYNLSLAKDGLFVTRRTVVALALCGHSEYQIACHLNEDTEVIHEALGTCEYMPLDLIGIGG